MKVISLREAVDIKDELIITIKENGKVVKVVRIGHTGNKLKEILSRTFKSIKDKVIGRR